jgi:hypothetical protein
MAKLVALKRLTYPRGTGAKEYNPGDTFEALSDRDAKALKLVGRAKDAAPSPAPARRTAKQPVTPEPEPPQPDQSIYNRRDMRPED